MHAVGFAFGTFMHAVIEFHYRTVNVSAASAPASPPPVRVNWNTTLPPDCVTSVRVEFRNSSRGPVVATYTTTNTSQTEVIQTGLQCAIYKLLHQGGGYWRPRWYSYAES